MLITVRAFRRHCAMARWAGYDWGWGVEGRAALEDPVFQNTLQSSPDPLSYLFDMPLFTPWDQDDYRLNPRSFWTSWQCRNPSGKSPWLAGSQWCESLGPDWLEWDVDSDGGTELAVRNGSLYVQVDTVRITGDLTRAEFQKLYEMLEALDKPFPLPPKKEPKFEVSKESGYSLLAYEID